MATCPQKGANVWRIPFREKRGKFYFKIILKKEIVTPPM
jgi:hypothetical protein